MAHILSRVSQGPERATTVSGRRPRFSGITWRSMTLSALLIPLNAYWVVDMELIRYSSHPTTISLFFNAIFLLLLVTGANAIVARRKPTWRLTQPELLASYSMVCVASALCSHDFLQVLVPSIAWPFMYATRENRWAILFNQYIPTWLSVQDKAAMAGYFTGESTLYSPLHLLTWATPVLMWSLFITALVLVMLCINAILRQQWDRREALTYPLTMLPLEITHPAGHLFRQRLLWIGFGIAAFIDAVNSIAFFYPDVTRIRVELFDLLPFFNLWPWSSMWWFPISFYPFVIGMGVLMPVDFLFSCWFFFLFWKAETVLSAWLGFNVGRPEFPYINQQSFGAYMVFFLFALWQSRRHLAAVLGRAMGLRHAADDSEEPASYRLAVAGALLGLAVLILFSAAMGMSAWLAVAFFAIYFALSISVIRMRAEFGSPVHDLHWAGPDYILVQLGGSASFRPQDLTAMAQYFWFNRAYRSHPMPHQLEGFRLMRSTDSLDRRYFPAMIVMGIFGTLVGFWAMLHINHSYGAMAKASGSFGSEAFMQLQNWLTVPQGPNYSAAAAIAVGFVIAFVLAKLRLVLSGWPFHPLGFAVSSSWEMNLVWMPLLIAWLLKLVILRYSGLRGFRRTLPFFYGLILGQFVIGSLLNLITMAFGVQRIYMFWF